MAIDPIGYLLDPIIEAWDQAHKLSKVTLVGGSVMAGLRYYRHYTYVPPPAPPALPPPRRPLPPPPPAPSPLASLVSKYLQTDLGEITDALPGKSDRENVELQFIQQLLDRPEIDGEETNILLKQVRLVATSRPSIPTSLPEALQKEASPDQLAEVKSKLKKQVGIILSPPPPPPPPKLSPLGQLLRTYLAGRALPKGAEEEKKLGWWIATGHVKGETPDVYGIELLFMKALLGLQNLTQDEVMGLFLRFEEVQGELDEDYTAQTWQLGSGEPALDLERLVLRHRVELYCRDKDPGKTRITPTEDQDKPETPAPDVPDCPSDSEFGNSLP